MNNRSAIIEEIKLKYINQYLESAKKISYRELTKENGVEKVFYDELRDREMYGYPTASDMVAPDGSVYDVVEFEKLPQNKKKECRLRFYYMPKYHELYVGTTGSGKTTGCVEPQLRAISTQKNKPNIFVTDPKGELFNKNATHLKNNGYRLFVLNFKDVTQTDNWNPLLELYDKKMELKAIGDGVVIKNGKVPKKVQLATDEELFKGKESYLEYKGKAYPDHDHLEQAFRKEKDEIDATVSQLVSSLATLFIPVTTTKDPTWEYGAQDLLRGILFCMLEDAINPSSGFERDMMTIKTMSEYYLALKLPIQSDERKLFGHELLKNKSQDATLCLCTALNNAPNTMKSYTGVFDGHMNDWLQGHIFSLTSGNTVNIDDDSDAPFAFFLITRDYDKSDNIVAGLAIDWVYRTTLQRVESGKKCRALHFLLDEFGNIPKIKDFENKIATARSRNIWFHLFVQSYQQLDMVYGQDVGAIIRDNCNTQAFLGSQSMASKKLFSEECGSCCVPSLESMLDATCNSVVAVPILPLSHLDLIKPGEIYIKRLGTPLYLAQYIRSYVCVECGIFNKCTDGLAKYARKSLGTFSDEKYRYPALAPFLDGSYKNFDW